jgi:exopolysaccharide biosynthesis polyprenyl glycosylphosphotransferase
MQSILLKKLILLAGDAVLIVAAFYFAPALRFANLIDFFTVFDPVDIASIFSYLFIFYIFDLYTLEEQFSGGAFIIRFAVALAIANIFIAATFFLFRVPLYSAGIFFLNSTLIFCFCMGWRIAFQKLSDRTRQPLRLAILGAGESGQAFYEMVKKMDYQIVAFLDDDEKKWGSTVGNVSVIGGSDLLPSLVRDRRIDKVIVAITHAIRPEVYKQLITAKFSGVNVYEMPTFCEMVMEKIPVRHVSDSWLTHTTMSGVRRSAYTQRVKRVIDILLSLCGLIVTLPLMAVVWIAIRLDSPGPALFIQRRIGWQGRPFNLIKFRSMRQGCEKERMQAGCLDDPRITRVGKILRLFRFDELPQLWNVLKGEMSFIGPRALMEEEVREFDPAIPYFGLRHAVRPGITGWAQVNYPHGVTMEDALEKLQYDLYYLKNMSFVLDLHILLRTVRVVLFRKGAR